MLLSNFMFDLSQVEFNKFDIKRKVRIPTEISPELCEEIGINIGDGSIYLTERRAEYRIGGNPKDEWDYFLNFLMPLYKRLFNLQPKIRREKTAICLTIYSRAIVTFKTKVLGLPSGKKSHIVTIPQFILKNKEFFVACLRGIFDTDGSVFIDKSQNRPIVDITSSSPLLLETIKKYGKKLNFNMYYSGPRNLRIQGWKNFMLWVKLIGSHNPKNIIRFNRILSECPHDVSMDSIGACGFKQIAPSLGSNPSGGI